MKLKFYNILIIVCLFTIQGFAHDTNKAFFEVSQRDGIVIVKAEFPWTIRNAVLQEFPSLHSSKNQIDFDNALFDYIKKNLIIINTKEEELQLLTVVKGESLGHSHQNNFVITYKGSNFISISNTIMCAINKSQKNYHTLKNKNGETKFITTNEMKSFNKSNPSAKKNTLYLIVALVLFMILLATIYYLRKKSN